MKTKHYIYIAIGLLLAVIIGVPAYYYCKGYTIYENPYKSSILRQATILNKSSKTFFFAYAYFFWTKIATKTMFWELQKPKKITSDDIIIFT